jgi:hypothetical protein
MRRGLMEKIMNKTNTSKFGHGRFEDRPLDDAELNAVTGWQSYEEVTFEYTERTLGGPDTRRASGNVAAKWNVCPAKHG